MRQASSVFLLASFDLLIEGNGNPINEINAKLALRQTPYDL
jgi:hypothetical protein